MKYSHDSRTNPEPIGLISFFFSFFKNDLAAFIEFNAGEIMQSRGRMEPLIHNTCYFFSHDARPLFRFIVSNATTMEENESHRAALNAAPGRTENSPDYCAMYVCIKPTAFVDRLLFVPCGLQTAYIIPYIYPAARVYCTTETPFAARQARYSPARCARLCACLATRWKTCSLCALNAGISLRNV